LTTPNDPAPKKKRMTPAYLLFHLLLSEDTWRIVIGVTLAAILAPYLLPFDRTGMGRYVMFITAVVIGWAVSKVPSQWVVRRLRLLFPDR
jgi:hypothetical protein